MFTKNPNVTKYFLSFNTKFFLMSPNRKISLHFGGRFAPDFGDIRKLMFTKFCDISSHNIQNVCPKSVTNIEVTCHDVKWYTYVSHIQQDNWYMQ